METLHRRCAGLDVHQKEIVACRRIASGRKVQSELGRFSTTTQGLLAPSTWLAEAKVTHVAMEATGIYWKPVWHVLCQDFSLVLANASRIRNVPGRKSDANDATWIADLLAHGLIRASFVPPQPIQELRDLTRTRRELTREIVRHTQRIQATLEEANIKLASVISDILGFSGRRILKAIVAGESDSRRLAELGHSRLACTREDLAAALDGRPRDHHRFLIGQHLKTIEQLEGTIAQFDARLEAALAPFLDAAERLKDIRLRRQCHPNPTRRGRRRHDRFPYRRPSDLLGRHVSTARRKRRPKALEAPAQGRAVAEARARPSRTRRHQGQEFQPASAILQPQAASRRQEGDHRRRSRNAAHRLSHTQGRNVLPGPRTRLPRSQKSRTRRPKPRKANPSPRI